MIGRSTWTRVVACLACAALIAGAFALAGCGGTKESPGGPANVEEKPAVDEAAKAAVLKALDESGLKFTKDYLAVNPAGPDSYLITAGTIRGKDGKAVRKVTVTKGKDGKWTVSTE